LRPVVVDCSAAVAWCFEDQATSVTDAWLDHVIAAGGVVPLLWHHEIANVLLRAERHGKIPTGHSDELLDELAALEMTTDSSQWRDTRIATVSLVRRHNLTIYDAVYLELALRLDARLATRDVALRAAALAEGVTLLA